MRGALVGTGVAAALLLPGQGQAAAPRTAHTFFSAKATFDRHSIIQYVCVASVDHRQRGAAILMVTADFTERDPWFDYPNWHVYALFYGDGTLSAEAQVGELDQVRVEQAIPGISIRGGMHAFSRFALGGAGTLRMGWAGWEDADVACTLTVDGVPAAVREEPPERARYALATDFRGGAGAGSTTVGVEAQASALGHYRRFTDGYLMALFGDWSDVSALRGAQGWGNFWVDGPEGEHYANNGLEGQRNDHVFVHKPTRGEWTYSMDLSVGYPVVLWILEATP